MPALPFLPAFLIVAALGAAALSGACSGSDEGSSDRGPAVERPVHSGVERPMRIGLGAVPANRTGEAYIDTFATAAQYADTIVIQRPPPWADFLPGATISEETTATTDLETGLLAQYPWLTVMFAIDVTDPAVQRARAVDLPAGIDPVEGFASEELREALLAYTAYVAKNYRPEYLAIGVEINMLYERSRPQFDAFVALYRDLYDQAKAASPRTMVFPTFQLEDLLGRLDQVHNPHWEVLDPFRDKMDALAVTTYPFAGNIRAATDIGPDYYDQLTRQFEGPIIVAPAGYPSAPVEGEALVGTEQDQNAFLQRLLEDAERLGFELISWIAPRDPAAGSGGVTASLKDTGLRRSDGANKAAWSTWEAWATRPVATR